VCRGGLLRGGCITLGLALGLALGLSVPAGPTLGSGACKGRAGRARVTIASTPSGLMSVQRARVCAAPGVEGVLRPEPPFTAAVIIPAPTCDTAPQHA
jgi:hypothetical protein